MYDNGCIIVRLKEKTNGQENRWSSESTDLSRDVDRGERPRQNSGSPSKDTECYVY